LKFKGQEWILINEDDNRNEGAITTVELFESFEMNPYHLFPNGDIMSYGEVVGNISEIEWLE
jgi:hypothetical protein